MLLYCSALQARVASTHALFAGPSALQHCALTLCCFFDHPKAELKVKMSTRSVDVAVVGAGISGLVAATTLQGKHTVAVLEARGRSGGRLLSPRGIDLGASWSWPPGDRYVRATEASSSFFNHSVQASHCRTVADATFRCMHRAKRNKDTIRNRHRLRSFLQCTSSKHVTTLRLVFVSRAVASVALPEKCSNRRGRRRVAALASRLQLRAVAQRLRGEAFAYDPRKGAVSLGNVGDRMAPCGPSAVRFEHGYASFTAALSAKLPHEDLMLGCQVTELSAAESGGIKVIYKRAGSSAIQTLRAKRVIVALPPAVHALSISYNPPLPASQSKYMASTSTWCGNWCKAVAFFRTPFWEKAGASGVSQTAGPFSIWWEGGAGSTHAEQPALVGLGVGEEVCKALAPYSETGVDDESAPQVRHEWCRLPLAMVRRCYLILSVREHARGRTTVGTFK
eukprot:3191375-Pleurochrysis_carterae.AAC.1